MSREMIEKHRDVLYNRYVHQRAAAVDAKRAWEQAREVELQLRAQVAMLNELLKEKENDGDGEQTSA